MSMEIFIRNGCGSLHLDGSRASAANDNRAVTIECATDTTAPYAMNSKVYATLIDLCLDICKRNGKTKLIWFGDKDKTLAYLPKPVAKATNYRVKITATVLNIRKGPGTNYVVIGQIKDKGVYTIVEESNGWGKLKSGAGWINLSYTKKV